MDRDHPAMALKPRILIVAGTDPTGGAGVVRDIETLSHFAANAAVAITAINIQNDHHVAKMLPQSGRMVATQMSAALTATPIGAIKIGMLATGPIARAVAAVLKNNPTIPVVLDPVLVASSGGALARSDVVGALQSTLLNRVNVLTPNIAELGRLSGCKAATSSLEAIAQAKYLMTAYKTGAVLVKGGHLNSKRAEDILVQSDSEIYFTSKRQPTTMRGTGCILSTAIATGLAQNFSLSAAIRRGKSYLDRLLSYKMIADSL